MCFIFEFIVLRERFSRQVKIKYNEVFFPSLFCLYLGRYKYIKMFFFFSEIRGQKGEFGCLSSLSLDNRCLQQLLSLR